MNLKRQLKVQKDIIITKENEIAALQRSLKYTTIQELKVGFKIFSLSLIVRTIGLRAGNYKTKAYSAVDCEVKSSKSLLEQKRQN